MIRNSKISIASLIELQKLLAKPIKELHFDNTQIINKEPTTKGNKIEILTLTFEHCRTLTNDGLAQLTVLFCPKQMYIDWASSKYIDINRTQYTLPHTNLFLVHFPFIFKHQVQPHEKRFAINDMKFYIQHTKRLLPTLEISQNLMACYQTINAHINLIEQSKSNNLPKLTLLKLILAKQIDSEVSSKDSLDLFMETYENCNKYMLRMIYESDRIEDFLSSLISH
ncbi:MAG: hypothetical protein HWD59_10290 [Coxiellaceae bacterium]|nr:MAG: hypothetical protein HWD59_10290 [Coxiellaceae bacterium]